MRVENGFGIMYQGKSFENQETRNNLNGLKKLMCNHETV